MSGNQTPTAAEREQTDESLRAEREITDQVLGDGEDSPEGASQGTDAEPTNAERAEQTALLAQERKETDNDLLRERERSDDALAIRDDFLGIVSHDLRNMLNSIVLAAGLIEDYAEGAHAEQITKCTERIRRGSARMDRLIGDLIDVASIEAGALTVTTENADAAGVVAEAIDVFQAQARASEISLQSMLVGKLAATFDPARILQVLSNLLGNAIKFTPRGGVVTVQATRSDGDLTISVMDTGAGVPADKLEVIFHRFLQLSRNDRRGLGLGLYISQCIVQGHGGRIWAESELGVGSKFSFTLPQAGGSAR